MSEPDAVVLPPRLYLTTRCGLSRTCWDDLLSRPRGLEPRPPSRGEHPPPQQAQARAPVPLALDQLQAVHVAFDRAVRPLHRQGRLHRRAVLLDSVRERDKRRQLTRSGRGEPDVECGYVSRSDHRAPLLQELVAARQVGIGREHLGEHRLLVRAELLRRP
jgi:hypothetical protein